MRLKILTLTILFVAVIRGSNGRPRDPDPLDGPLPEVAADRRNPDQSGSADSRVPDNTHRELKDLQHIDQSVRTVATQLLNTTAKHEDLVRIPEEKVPTIDAPLPVIRVSTTTNVQPADARIEETFNLPSADTSKMIYGIPINSKFGDFETSYPGQAMAMTDEEMERELSLMTSSTPEVKSRPTTSGGISTWILLNPPSTTSTTKILQENAEGKKNKKEEPKAEARITTTTKQPTTMYEKKVPTQKIELEIKPIAKIERVKVTTSHAPATTEPITISMSNSTTTVGYQKISTTRPPSTTELPSKDNNEVSNKKQQTRRTTPKDKMTSTTMKPATSKKPGNKNASTAKPKVTTTKPATAKQPKPSKATRKPAVNKNDPPMNTPKIEKVTLKPSTQNRTEADEKPIFVSKLKASVKTQPHQSTTIPPPISIGTTIVKTSTSFSKSNHSNSDIITLPASTKAPKVNIIKAHLKKPIDDSPNIEIQPIRVNAPILKIEKIETPDRQKIKQNQEAVSNPKIDLKFDFNPELTKIEVKTSTESMSSTENTTTKRSRPNKRKKNKNRRRKPSTTTASSIIANSATTRLKGLSATTEISSAENSVNAEGHETAQESKIEPETKVTTTNSTKNKKKQQLPKPLSTTIYNYLSREVMPSFGVMSLVGLGLGIASYFLYPFGGVIARRNYEVEPNYKYNLNEYGGNFGQSEEEVLMKVFQGMTNHESKHPPKNHEKPGHYYRYTTNDQPNRYPGYHGKTSGNPAISPSNPIYRPVDSTDYDLSYRNTEFKYPDVPTTPNYYEKQRKADFSAGKGGNGNRQFVVGNVPKEYAAGYDEGMETALPTSDKSRPNFEAMPNAAAVPLTASLTTSNDVPTANRNSKVNEEPLYDDIEINPSAVAVEHGPRMLDLTSYPSTVNVGGQSRAKRDTVIQMIPSKSEIEKEQRELEEEQDLSNEIFDIIDTALPGIPDKDLHRKKLQKEQDDQAYSKNKASSQNSSKKDIPTETNETKKLDPSISTTGQSTKVNPSISSAIVTPKTIKTSERTVVPPTSTKSRMAEVFNKKETTTDWFKEFGSPSTTQKPKPPEKQGFNIFQMARNIAEIKVRLGLTILKHASEGFARYIGHIQKRFNGEE